ncbi:MAG: cytochrome C, partial [Candidatus Rokubacteria bacterium]|nr:cytochrome C [Candidatus Rokubacteria bacterium]
FYYPGCFRCHDGQHVSPEGKVIRKDCEICHTLLGQEEGGQPMAEVRGRPFRHPVEIGDLAEATCSGCHTGGPGP